MRRITVALLAIFSAFLLGFAAPATAGGPSFNTTDGHAANRAATERALPWHTVRRLRASEIRNSGWFYVKGKAVTYKGRVVKLQKAGTRHGHYRTVERDRTRRRDGFFRMTFEGKIGTHWRLLIPRTNWARATPIYLGRICREGATNCG